MTLRQSFLAGVILLVSTTLGQASVIVATGSSFTWDGVNGPSVPLASAASVPNNLALTANGATAFAINSYGAPHSIAGLNNGSYGNSSSWIGASGQSIDLGGTYGTVNTSFAGVGLPGLRYIASFAFGRSNITGQYDDRDAGTYYIQTTTAANPNAGTADSLWTTIGSITISGGTGNYNDAYRHQFVLSSPVQATGIRIVAPAAGDTCIDEIELGSWGTLHSAGTGSAPLPGINIARQGTAFAQDVYAGGTNPNHTIAHLNDGQYGNSFSWLGASVNSFAGVAFSAPSDIISIAFGRDNTGAVTDRYQGSYILQYTRVANPNASTPDGDWTTIGAFDYTATFPDASGWVRHVYQFDRILGVTGVRVRVSAADQLNPIAIDELEVGAVPEPTTLTLALLAAAGLAAVVHRRRSSRLTCA
jgi:hypothetical protein